MTYKHQSKNYRNKNGIRFICWGDMPGMEEADTELEDMRLHGITAFKENHGDYYRVFISEEQTKEKGLI